MAARDGVRLPAEGLPLRGLCRCVRGRARSEPRPERIREWATRYGEPPARSDWNPWQARWALGDEQRARRFERDKNHWPYFTDVVRYFGSWNAGIAAAGFAVRAVGGTAENQKRRRYRRSAA